MEYFKVRKYFSCKIIIPLILYNSVISFNMYRNFSAETRKIKILIVKISTKYWNEYKHEYEYNCYNIL